MQYSEIARIGTDEVKAIECIERLRWPGGPVCPHCGMMGRIYDLRATRVGLRKCGRCRKQFTVRIGTIFEDSHIPMWKWLRAIHDMCASKKGVSAHQLHRTLEITYKSAWFMCHRIRFAMTQSPLVEKLGAQGGVVEVDETYVGGKSENNKHKNRKPKQKAVVMTLVERDGDVRSVPVPNNKRETLQGVVRRHVSDTAHIMTDSAMAYPGLADQFATHRTVNHSHEYVRGIVHTNFAESYHSLLKRGLLGTFHHVSQKHLPRYLDEFAFRWNSRKATDGSRAVQAVRGADGKRLMYKRPVTR